MMASGSAHTRHYLELTLLKIRRKGKAQNRNRHRQLRVCFGNAFGSDAGVKHFGRTEKHARPHTIYVLPDGQNMTALAEIPAGTHSANLAGYQVPFGSFLYVRAVAKPGLMNHSSGPVAVK
jgi:hypothetical protein